MMQTKCDHCGQEFEPISDKQIACSLACAVELETYHRTAIKRSKLSRPAKWAKDHLHPTQWKGSILDFGCGRGDDVAILCGLGLSVVGYDVNGCPCDEPSGPFNIILCTYVLNVIHNKGEREGVRRQVLNRLAPSGVAVFSVRRDIPKGGTKTQVWVAPPTKAMVHIDNADMCLWTESRRQLI